MDHNAWCEEAFLFAGNRDGKKNNFQLWFSIE